MGQTHGMHDNSLYERCSLDNMAWTCCSSTRWEGFSKSPDTPSLQGHVIMETAMEVAVCYESTQFLHCAGPSFMQQAFR